MRRTFTLLAVLMILAALLCACGSTPVSSSQAAASHSSESQASESPSTAETSAPTGQYKDGTYQYTGKKDGEGYHVEGTMVVSNGAIQSMEWQIVDDNNSRVFDATYEDVFNNDAYKQQCRYNLSGMQTYVPALLDKQNPDSVDVVSGATWAYHKFEEAAKALLAQAKK